MLKGQGKLHSKFFVFVAVGRSACIKIVFKELVGLPSSVHLGLFNSPTRVLDTLFGHLDDFFVCFLYTLYTNPSQKSVIRQLTVCPVFLWHGPGSLYMVCLVSTEPTA